jgi:serine/threonine protein kinase
VVVLAAGYLPFNDGSLVNMYRKIYAGKFRCPAWFSPALRRVLDPDPATRIDADGIVAHPWFRHGASDEEESWWWFKDDDVASRDMTAFDMLTFSSGSDLSAIFGAGPGKERVFVSEPAAGSRRPGKRKGSASSEREEALLCTSRAAASSPSSGSPTRSRWSRSSRETAHGSGRTACRRP